MILIHDRVGADKMGMGLLKVAETGWVLGSSDVDWVGMGITSVKLYPCSCPVQTCPFVTSLLAQVRCCSIVKLVLIHVHSGGAYPCTDRQLNGTLCPKQ